MGITNSVDDEILRQWIRNAVNGPLSEDNMTMMMNNIKQAIGEIPSIGSDTLQSTEAVNRQFEAVFTGGGFAHKIETADISAMMQRAGGVELLALENLPISFNLALILLQYQQYAIEKYMTYSQVNNEEINKIRQLNKLFQEAKVLDEFIKQINDQANQVAANEKLVAMYNAYALKHDLAPVKSADQVPQHFTQQKLLEDFLLLGGSAFLLQTILDMKARGSLTNDTRLALLGVYANNPKLMDENGIRVLMHASCFTTKNLSYQPKQIEVVVNAISNTLTPQSRKPEDVELALVRANKLLGVENGEALRNGLGEGGVETRRLILISSLAEIAGNLRESERLNPALLDIATHVMHEHSDRAYKDFEAIRQNMPNFLESTRLEIIGDPRTKRLEEGISPDDLYGLFREQVSRFAQNITPTLRPELTRKPKRGDDKA